MQKEKESLLSGPVLAAVVTWGPFLIGLLHDYVLFPTVPTKLPVKEIAGVYRTGRYACYLSKDYKLVCYDRPMSLKSYSERFHALDYGTFYCRVGCKYIACEKIDWNADPVTYFVDYASCR